MIQLERITRNEVYRDKKTTIVVFFYLVGYCIDKEVNMHYKKYKKILSTKNSMNIYRGCSHGCIYCDSRSKCYQMSHAFEDIEVKTDAPIMLDRELRSKRKKCMIGTGAMSDPYIPIEKELRYTRKCLETILNQKFGVSLLTKSNLILRDIDLLQQINEVSKCVVQVTLTTADEALCKVLEPNVSSTKERVEILKECKDRKIPTIVWLGPFLPFINDDETNMRRLLDYCVQQYVHGILCFGIGVTMREGNREYFYDNLDTHFPLMKQKYNKAFQLNYECGSKNHRKLMTMIKQTCVANNMLYGVEPIFKYISAYEEKKEVEQLSLF